MATQTAADIAAQNLNIPADYAASMEAIAPGITGAITASQGGAMSWTTSLLSLLVAATNLTPIQTQLLNQEVSNFNSGAGPVDPSQYGLSSAAPSDSSASNTDLLLVVAILAAVVAAM